VSRRITILSGSQMLDGFSMSDAPRQSSAGRPPDPTKRAAILAAAQELFASRGFTATSMDAVAKSAGVSKLTAYRHFGSKDHLFAEAVTARCSAMLSATDAAQVGLGDARAALVGFGRAFLALIMHEEALAVHRLVIAERERAPQLGQIFHASAIVPTKTRLARLIEQLSLPVDDNELAATDLLALWRGKPMLAIETGTTPWSSAEIQRHIERTVDLCLGGWAAMTARI
jgi:TetR/AcrR family transcriptional regulator, mexJK operon transcriptional repressor